MVTKERPDQQEEGGAWVSESSVELIPVATSEPAAPEGMADDEAQELKHRAVDLATRLEEASGSAELQMVDSMSSLGIRVQRDTGTELELLRTRVGEMLTSDGAGSQISRELVDWRLALDQINPHELSQRGLMRRVFGVIPFVERLTPVLRVLEKIAIRYESVSKQVEVLEVKLRQGRAMLARDNLELRKLYEQVETQQQPIQKNAYLGELIMGQLQVLVERTDDTLKVERVRNALHDVSMRVQDLRTMEEVHIQYFVSIEMTRQNNSRLGQSVERTLALGTTVVMVGLALQAALARQKRVLEATQRTREFLGNLIVANAATIKRHTAEIGDVYSSPVIAVEKITQAHNDLLEAMDMADRVKQEGIESARQNIARLVELSTDLEQRSRGLREQHEAEPRSIEA